MSTDNVSVIGNGGQGGVFSSGQHDSRAEEQWSTVRSQSKKRKFSKNSVSEQNMNLEEFKMLSMDDTLIALFSNMSSNNESVQNMNNKIDQCVNLVSRVQEVEIQLSDHDMRLLLLEYKSIDLEARSRRGNLIFGGISESKGENCLETIANFLYDHLRINSEPCMSRAHRMGKFKQGSTRSIIVNFIDSKDTEYIISRAHMLKGKDYHINRDFPPEIESARRKLWPKFKEVKRDFPDSKVAIVYPAKLIIDRHLIADIFPHWNRIMQRDRLTIGKPQYSSYDPYAARAARALQNSRPGNDTVINTGSIPPRSETSSAGITPPDNESSESQGCTRGNTSRSPRRGRRESRSP
ncbi:uncharacterized protein LOC128552647 [Mercenaria mercenaria]|uniref:uncharacterized protein LOC128552647 n=1 Tax=Mercenaria mercenaria TaxID=6596 RepID=UPI00234E3A14|nr:uncharacterized protein LOC128552647 [Mercenaria mercenaria]